MTEKQKTSESSANPEVVAAWMLKELQKQNGVLHQDEAASQIGDLFGERFVYESQDSGNLCIGKEVLAAFRKLTGDSVVWSRGERLWRRRESCDEPTRRQD